MPILNQLGNYYFLNLHRVDDPAAPPDIPAQLTEIVQRPGFSGTGIIQLGRNAQPFQMRSFVDVSSFAGANIVAAYYKDEAGRGPYGMIWNGMNYTALFNVVYAVLQVDIVKVKALRSAIGGIDPPSLACVEAVWTLQALEITGEE